MPLLTSLGLISLALGGLSGWLVVGATQKPDWFRSREVPVPHRFLQAHLDWIIMGLILIAVQVAVPAMPNWIRGTIAFGTIVNPLLFVPLAWGNAVTQKAAYKVVAILSFLAVSVGLSSLAIWAIAIA